MARHHLARIHRALQDCSRGQLVEKLHRLSCSEDFSAGVRNYAAGACEALSSRRPEPRSWQVENLEDRKAFRQGWRDVRASAFKLTMERFAVQ